MEVWEGDTKEVYSIHFLWTERWCALLNYKGGRIIVNKTTILHKGRWYTSVYYIYKYHLCYVSIKKKRRMRTIALNCEHLKENIYFNDKYIIVFSF